MYQIEEINIKKMIVHILDCQLSIPILSMDEVPSGYDTKLFFATHILKTLNDDALKPCEFTQDQNVFLNYLTDYQNDTKTYVDFTRDIASRLFDIMTVHPTIVPCDLAIIEFTLMTKPYLALLKLNYQSTYIHFTDYESDININTIVEHKTTLPSPGQKVSEAIIIELENQNVHILEKKYELDGHMDFYLSKLYLQCATNLSSKEQMKIVKSTTEQISKKFYEHNPEKQAEIQQNLYNALDEHGTIMLDNFVSETFNDQTEVKELFLDKLEKKGLKEPIVHLNEKTISRTFEKQRVKTDTGIEIKIPMELYNDPNSMEFVTGADGKINIILKNIGKIL